MKTPLLPRMLAAALLAAAACAQAGWTTAPAIPGGARAQHAAARYSPPAGNDSVMVSGGNTGTVAAPVPLNDTQIFDIASRTWSSGPPLPSARYGHTLTALASGRILLVGGRASVGTDPAASHTYTPGDATFVATAPMLTPRSHHTATSLIHINNTVVVIGGRGGTATSAAALMAVEVYDAATRTWSYSEGLPGPRYHHTATLLQDGRILVVGGLDDLHQPRSDAWVRATNGTWTSVPMPPGAPNRAYHTATGLWDGRVLIAGGTLSPAGTSALNSTYVFNPGDNTWAPGPKLLTPRHSHATSIQGGDVVLIGGSDGLGATASTESLSQILANPSTIASTAQPAMTEPRIGLSFTSVGSSLYLAVGGHATNGTPSATAEIYEHATPNRPNLLSVTPGDGKAIAQWAQPAADPNDPAITRYTVRAVRQDGQLPIGACYWNGATPAPQGCEVLNLDNGVPYDFTVIAHGVDGSSQISQVLVATPQAGPLQAPTGLAATAGNGQVALTWSAPASGTAPTGYTVTAQPGGRTCTPTPATAVACTVTGLTNGTAYTFTVTATAAGGATATSAPTAPVTPNGPAGAVLHPPTAVAGTAGNGQVMLTWQAPTTQPPGSVTPTHYTVLSSPGFFGCGNVPAPATTCTVTGLTNGATYTFIVRAHAGGVPGITTDSAPSATVTPSAAGPGPGGPAGAQPVPVLGVPGLALLGLGAAALGARRLRRKATVNS